VNVGSCARDHDLFLVPLRVQRRLGGLIVVGPSAAVDGEARAALESLGSQISLGLETAALTEDLLRHRSEERFAAVVQTSSDVITVLAADLTVRYQTPSIRQVLGHEPLDLVGASLLDLLHPDDEPHARHLLSQDGLSLPQEWRVRRADGGWATVEMVVNNLLDHPDVEGIVITARDISQRKALEQQLRDHAFHDSLTGLANTVLLTNRVEHALTTRVCEGRGVCVMRLDLDDFNHVNDRLGHSRGDELLVAIARRLTENIRPMDTAARIGGDEFAILVSGPTSGPEAVAVAERVLGAVNEPVVIRGVELRVKASVGIAIGTSAEVDAEQLLRQAYVAMHGAKSRGKARHELFKPEVHQPVIDSLDLQADLERAIRDEALVLHYQPIMALRNSRIAGFEALVRWQHPERGLIPPSQFIPLAEETGLIVPIGRFVLREACRQAVAWTSTDGAEGQPTVSVNVSARQLQDRDLVRDVSDALALSGLPASRLVLEITESVLVDVVDPATGVLEQLRGLGLSLAIDDFGTGYSSLSYLHRLPVDTLKIDRSFIDRLDDPDESLLAQTIVRLGRVLGLQTVAEGVERTEQADILREIECDYGQGYHFARPLEPAAVAELLASQRRPAPPAPPGPAEVAVAAR
ncbi:MAG: putative bifunctional diguanylate cyclase/phosphodiesterase, partial [Acidimicrobiales bacterium]